MYINIKDIMKASVCSFCENIYEYESLDENEFMEFLKDFLEGDDLDESLERCTAEIAYDIEDIDNKCRDILYRLKSKKFEYENILEHCKKAYLRTLVEDKTINVEAFVDNLTEEFKKS